MKKLMLALVALMFGFITYGTAMAAGENPEDAKALVKKAVAY